MDITAQTLVLVDNSLSVSKVNREISKLTLQYLFAHTPEGRAYCLTPFSHDMEYVESYTTDYIGLEDMVSRIEYENKETSLTDVISRVLNEWSESDYACRDILILTDGLEDESQYYEREELFYLIDHTDYPIYIVCLDQNDNEKAVKNLSAICRTSEGVLFHTEFSGSDAEVERQLSEQILAAMDVYSRNNWQKYNEQTDENVIEGEESGETGDKTTLTELDNGENGSENMNYEDIIMEEYTHENAYSENESSVIYENTQDAKGVFVGTPMSFAVIGVSFFFIICGVFLSWCLILRHKGKEKIEADAYRDMIRRKVREQEDMDYESNDYLQNSRSNKPEHGKIGETVALVERSNRNMTDGMTRLLYEDGGVADMTFEDANDPSKFYRISSFGKTVLGRSASCCDIAFDYDDSVSSRHCELFSRDNSWYVKDLSSSNGTLVNGQKVYTESPILSGDLLQMGSLSLIVRFI